jgi:hypothetical protein
MTQGPLEEISLWYKYKSAVWPPIFADSGTKEPSEQAITIHNIMRVLRAFRNLTRLAYASVPITTGRYYYERPKNGGMAGLLTMWAIKKEAIAHNYAAGFEFVRQLMSRLDCPILFPADLTTSHQEWEQEHFLALWLNVIAERCTELHMSKDWEFSNGCCMEFVHVMQLRLGLPHGENWTFYNMIEHEETERKRMRNIAVFDHEGKPLSIEDGIRKIESSMAWIKGKRFDVETLEECLRLLHRTEDLIGSGFYQ